MAGSPVPDPIQSSRTFLLNAAGSVRTPFMEVLMSKLRSGALNEPIHAKVPRFFDVICSVCPPPIDSPAMARLSRSASVR